LPLTDRAIGVELPVLVLLHGAGAARIRPDRVAFARSVVVDVEAAPAARNLRLAAALEAPLLRFLADYTLLQLDRVAAASAAAAGAGDFTVGARAVVHRPLLALGCVACTTTKMAQVDDDSAYGGGGVRQADLLSE